MDVESPNGSSRQLRVRSNGYVNPLTGRGVFRIENQAGQVLRRIGDARNAQEALAFYWRTVGVALSEPTMSKDLDRRIARARKNLDPRILPLETPELPFEAIEEAPQVPVKAPASKRGRPKRVTAPQIDLFTPEEPSQEAAAAEAEPEVPVEAAPIEAEVPLPASPPEAQAEPEPHHLDPQAVMLQRVDPRNLRPTDRADSYLYHITNGPDADVALRQGISVSASDPVILTERQGVAYWLSVLAEDYDYILDGPADFVVLRLRRMAVEELLEHDPYASRSAGCPCYLLTGGATSRAQATSPGRSR